MPLSLTESQAINEMADLLYSFLPGTPHPRANQSISFPGVAREIGLYIYWTGGSKRPAITTLLEKTLEFQKGKFCDLVLGIVRTGMKYRNGKSEPITREEIQELNDLILKVEFKIPELWDPKFLDTLPRKNLRVEALDDDDKQGKIEMLRNSFVKLSDLQPQTRGFEFEKFLQEMFEVFDLRPHSPFRLKGEQIDGSFQIDPHTYLVEAKWQNSETGLADFLVFQGKVGGKARWSRGLFISFNGFSEEGLEAFSRNATTSILGMTGQDVYFVLDGEISLIETSLPYI
jgi:hypothetical protein